MIVETPAQAESRQKSEAESTEHERLDLEAQEKAADAAFEQVAPNRIGAFLTVFGTLAVFWTLILTQRSLNLSRRTSVAELRAYLGVYSYKAARQEDGGLHLSFVVQNCGQTPAVRLQSEWSMITGPVEPVPEEFTYPTNSDTRQRVGLLTPNSELNFGPGRLPAAKVRALIANTTHCYIFGWIDYDDSLGGERHRLEFCTRVEAAKNLEGTGHDFRFATTPKHNAMDGDCERQPEPW